MLRAGFVAPVCGPQRPSNRVSYDPGMNSTYEKESGANGSSVKKSGTVIKQKQTTQCKMNSLNKAFQNYGPQCPDEIAKAMEGVELPLELEAYVNEFALRSEERVLERMQHNPEFVQCASWSELLASKGFRETCNNELPLALQTIAYTEKFPKPEHAKDVDFQLLYLNLASMMMGQPVRRMNAATQKLLKQVYEDTVDQANKADQKEDLQLLHEHLKRMRKPTPSGSKASSVRDLKDFFMDPNINPFQLPMEKVCSKNSP